MRLLPALSGLLMAAGLSRAGAPVRGIIYLQQVGGAGGVYRASFSYDGEGWLSACEPEPVEGLPNLRAMFMLPNSRFTFPRNPLLGAPTIIPDQRFATNFLNGIVDSQLLYDMGDPPVPLKRTVHVCFVDLEVPFEVFNDCKQARIQQTSPPGDDPNRDPDTEDWSLDDPRVVFPPTPAAYKQFIPLGDPFSESRIWLGGRLVGQTRADDPLTLLAEFRIPQGLRPWGVVPDWRGHLMGFDPWRNELVLIDYSRSGLVGDPLTQCVTAPIPGLEHFNGQMIVMIAAMHCLGDASGDCEVNLYDIVSTVSRFGAVLADDDWVGDADADGVIGIRDIAAVLANYGASCH